MKVIALKGLANTGKTSTIILLCDKHLINPECNEHSSDSMCDEHSSDSKPAFSYCRYTSLPGDSKNHYKRIYSLSTETKKYKVGVCSEGDTAQDLKEAFNSFESENCDIAIVACRTKGGSFETVKTSSSDVIWAGKSQDGTSCDERIAELNRMDAKKLLDILLWCLKMI